MANLKWLPEEMDVRLGYDEGVALLDLVAARETWVAMHLYGRTDGTNPTWLDGGRVLDESQILSCAGVLQRPTPEHLRGRHRFDGEIFELQPPSLLGRTDSGQRIGPPRPTCFGLTQNGFRWVHLFTQDGASFWDIWFIYDQVAFWFTDYNG